MCSTKESYSWTLLIFFKFIDNIKTLLGALGLKTLNEVPKATAETIYFYCNKRHT